MEICNTVCPICNIEHTNLQKLFSHYRKNHSGKKAEDLYNLINPTCDKNCRNCGVKTGFIRLSKGYKTFCSNKCLNLFRKNDEIFKLEILKKQVKCVREKYGVDNVSQLESIIKKRKNTWIEKYGVDHPSKNEEIKKKTKSTINKHFPNGISVSDETKEKIKFTMLDRYGVDSPLKCKEIRDKYEKTCVERYGVTVPTKNKDVMEKIKSTNLERYGFEFPTSNCDIKNEMLKLHYHNLLKRMSYFDMKPMFDEVEYTGVLDEFGNSKRYIFKCTLCNKEEISAIVNNGRYPICRKCKPYNVSEDEYIICEYITNNLTELKITQGDKSILSGTELDIFISEKKIAIEFNGNYWHSELNGKDEKYHLNKTVECEKQGIKLIHILESEWVNKQDIVKSRLLNILGKQKERIFARKCTIKVPTYEEKVEFLEKNHLQGNDKSNIYYGLYFKDTLISVMTFNKYCESNECELIRFSSDIEFNVMGGFSKLLSHFKKTNHPKSIIVFVDRRWSSKNNIYEKMGFSFVHETDPTHRYFHKSNSLKLIEKVEFVKKFEIFNENISEWENMKNNGYDRIWDCGQLKYELINENEKIQMV